MLKATMKQAHWAGLKTRTVPPSLWPQDRGIYQDGKTPIGWKITATVIGWRERAAGSAGLQTL
jgi:hypothetical protein